MVLFTPAAATGMVAWRLTTDYTIAGNTITFVAGALAAGDLLDVHYASGA